MHTPHRLLLASQSPRRRELLALLELPFAVETPDVAETPQDGEPPAALAARLSRAKAHACSQHGGETTIPIIVACDTIVALADEVLGKPRDAEEAGVMLRQLRGRTHAVYSAVTVLEPATGHMLTQVAETQVAMRTYTDAEVATYVASGDPLDKAGAYAIQHAGFHPVSELRGCYANVMGLPLCHLTRCLRACDADPPADVPTACQTYLDRPCSIHPAILPALEAKNERRETPKLEA